MISNHDRSNYFGASDTSMVVGNWTTKTFEKFWLEKLGLYKNDFANDYTMAGTNFEHKILDKLAEKLGIKIEKDKQIISGRLRVNLDGNTENRIFEVKTHNLDKEFKISKQYWRQAQVEMFVSHIYNLSIVSYGLEDKDYNNFFNEVKEERIVLHNVEYDADFIEKEYKPKLEYLSKCLEQGIFPKGDA